MIWDKSMTTLKYDVIDVLIGTSDDSDFSDISILVIQ